MPPRRSKSPPSPPAPFQPNQFEFVNWNFFSVEWKNLKVTQYVLATEPVVGMGDCDIYETHLGYKYCGYELGNFASDNTFSTNAREVTYQNLPLKNVNYLNLGIVTGTCIASTGDLLLLSKGTVEASTSHSQFSATVDNTYALACY